MVGEIKNMRIKKDLMYTLFTNKKFYNILSDLTTEKQILKLKRVFLEVCNPFLYVLLQSNDIVNMQSFNYSKIIKLKNQYLLQLDGQVDLDNYWNLKRIRNTRDISIYLLSTRIVNESENEIRKLLFYSTFEFTIGNYLDVCRIGFDKKIYQEKFTDILNILIEDD